MNVIWNWAFFHCFQNEAEELILCLKDLKLKNVFFLFSFISNLIVFLDRIISFM